MVGVKGLVAYQSIKCETIDKVRHADNLAALTGKQFEPHAIALGIREGQNFARQSAF